MKVTNNWAATDLGNKPSVKFDRENKALILSNQETSEIVSLHFENPFLCKSLRCALKWLEDEMSQ